MVTPALVLVALLSPALAAAAPLPPQAPPRAPAPVRSPTAPGTPALTVITGAGRNAPPDREGDFLIGPDYVPAPEYTASPDVPKGKVFTLNLRSEDSRFYSGITRVPPGAPENYRPANLADLKSFPKPWRRTVTVYVPANYKAGTAAPLLVLQDGPDRKLPVVLDNLIAEHKVPALVAVMIQNGGGDAQGSERGLEYDTVSGKYAEWVQAEVLPKVEQTCGVTLTSDPDGRCTTGGSSGAAAAFSMAWFHPEWYHRVLSYSGTFVNQAWPRDDATPHGAWEYHAHLVPENPAKPIRIWMEVGDTDLLTNHDGYHDWVDANNRMAKALRAKGYHYQYVFAVGAGHTDRKVREQTLPEALEWVWQGFPKS